MREKVRLCNCFTKKAESYEIFQNTEHKRNYIQKAVLIPYFLLVSITVGVMETAAWSYEGGALENRFIWVQGLQISTVGEAQKIQELYWQEL